MRIPGKRLRQTRLVRTDRFVVAVDVEAVIPAEDSAGDEPCYESETVDLLREIELHAKQGDIDWLRQHGKVYVALDAA